MSGFVFARHFLSLILFVGNLFFLSEEEESDEAYRNESKEKGTDDIIPCLDGTVEIKRIDVGVDEHGDDAS